LADLEEERDSPHGLLLLLDFRLFHVLQFPKKGNQTLPKFLRKMTRATKIKIKPQ